MKPTRIFCTFMETYTNKIHMITLPCQSLCLVIFIIYKYKISKRVFMNNKYAEYYKDICHLPKIPFLVRFNFLKCAKKN